MARFDVITFDCYGTLIDWESGIEGAFRSAAPGRAALPAAAELLSAYAAIEPEVEAGPYRSYREILTETAVRVAGRFGWTITPAEASFLADSLASWRPFPDTNAALRRLAAAGCRLGILSNVDDDLFAGTRRHLDAAFDPVITAAQVRSYKPASAHFDCRASRPSAGRAVAPRGSELFSRRGALPRPRNPGRLDQPEGGSGRIGRAAGLGVERPLRPRRLGRARLGTPGSGYFFFAALLFSALLFRRMSCPCARS